MEVVLLLRQMHHAAAPYLSRGNDVTLPKEAAMGKPLPLLAPRF